MPHAHFRLSSYRGMGFGNSIRHKSGPGQIYRKTITIAGDEITYPTKKENCLDKT